MSVIIKGMSMPNDGREWIMFLRLTSGEVELFDPIGEDESVFYEAVELPPHGKLIDADALSAKLPAPIEDEYKHVRRIIEAAPTIIPAEGKEE